MFSCAVAYQFGFTGREHDLDASLVYARARYLSPNTGRWDRLDPKKFADGPNRYAYVRNQATSVVDPLGLFTTEVHDFIIGRAFSGYSDIGSIRKGSYDADHMSGTQGTAFSYMHAMRGPEDTYASAMAHWEVFILSALARAIVGVRTDCNPDANAMWELGFGGHALMDLYSPLHRFQVWSGLGPSHLPAAVEHGGRESVIQFTDPSVAAAIAGLRIFRGWFEENRKSAPLGVDAVLGILDRPDPLGMADGPNRYHYVRGKVTVAVDPTGLFLPDIHRQITRVAFAGLVYGDDLETVVRGSVEADRLGLQFDDYRHGMRAASTTLQEGARMWADFFDYQLASAVEWVNSGCGRNVGLYQLGIGVHAVEDYYSPPHRMRVMHWSPGAFADHIEAEEHLTMESGPVREAIASAREYALLFGWMQRLPMSATRQYMADLAWGLFGHLLYVDAVSQ